MKLLLNRKYKNCKIGTRTYCVGKLYVDGVYICDTIEDKDWGWDCDTPIDDIKAVKAKNKSMTAIPHGTYSISMSRVSPKFSRISYYKQFCGGKLPYLCRVPGFEGILIHKGASEKSSAGCVIVGFNTVKGQVTRSQEAFESLYRLLLTAKVHGEKITITII